MANSAVTIRDAGSSHRLSITHRDFGLLFGPGFSEGLLFVSEFGIYDNFTIANGIPKGSQVTQRGRKLHNIARALLDRVTRDADLLEYDYSFGFGDGRARHSGRQSIRVGGRHGMISALPKGFCSIELFDADANRPRVAEFIDLRIVESVETDDSGVVKVFRRKAKTHWRETLPPLIEFLKPRRDEELTIEQIDRADA